MEYIDAAAARKLYPDVKGEIFGAVLFSGFAVLDMGVGAIAAMVAGKMVACCPTFDHAVTAGRKEADRQAGERSLDEQEYNDLQRAEGGPAPWRDWLEQSRPLFPRKA